MSKLWRWLTPAAVAAGLVAAGGIPAATASTTAASTITINATSNYPGATNGKVDGYTLVIYKSTKYYSAKISGTATTTASGDTATLMGERFGATTYSQVDTPVTLTTIGTAAFSFRVAPSLATKYEVVISGTDTGTSTPVTVYVAGGGRIAGTTKRCTRTSCTFSYRQYAEMPASAYKTEAAKTWYRYLRVTYTKALPKYMYRTTNGSITRPRKVNSGEFELSVTFHIALHGSTYWYYAACSKDTESRDGLGLPGSHGCGSSRVRLTTPYLG